MQKMRVDMHNHTTLCNHATGSMREYVQRALELKIDVFGFSCHAPMEFDKKYRMSTEALPLYFAKTKDLEHEYEGKVQILRALEVDFILGREDLLLDCVINADVDYLIGSVHFLDEWGFDNPEFIAQWATRGLFDTWSRYLDSIQAMAQTRLFNICGHFDLPKLFGHKIPHDLMPKCYKTLEILYQNNMVLEINASGLRKKIAEQYPSYEILNMAREIGLDITFSSDAHDISHIGYGYERCLELARVLKFQKVAVFKDKIKGYVEV